MGTIGQLLLNLVEIGLIRLERTQLTKYDRKGGFR